MKKYIHTFSLLFWQLMQKWEEKKGNSPHSENESIYFHFVYILLIESNE